MIYRFLMAASVMICALSVRADEVAAIFGKADYAGSVADQIVFSEMACGGVYDIEGVCSISMTNLNSKYATYLNNQHLHWYKSDAMTVTPEEGMMLSSIKMQCTAEDYCDKLTASIGTAKYDKTTATITWTGKASAPFTLTASASQLRVSYAEIEYAVSDQSEVEEIISDEMTGSEPEYYTLTGVRVTSPSSGIYICRKGSKVTKIHIR